MCKEKKAGAPIQKQYSHFNIILMARHKPFGDEWCFGSSLPLESRSFFLLVLALCSLVTPLSAPLLFLRSFLVLKQRVNANV
jgi:hypothetical protein